MSSLPRPPDARGRPEAFHAASGRVETPKNSATSEVFRLLPIFSGPFHPTCEEMKCTKNRQSDQEHDGRGIPLFYLVEQGPAIIEPSTQPLLPAREACR